MALLKIFVESNGHPTAEEIHRKLGESFPMTSLATVYKTLAVLKDLGEALELETGNGGKRYDVRKPESHPHLVCIGCEKILDLDVDTLDTLSEKVAKDTGFQVAGHKLIFHGLCPECQDGKKFVNDDHVRERVTRRVKKGGKIHA